MRFTRSLSPVVFNYNLNDHSLSTSAQHPYLGILLDNKLSWSSHTKHIITKANKTLNFLKRNLNSCSSSVKASAYLTLVRPSMEYAAAVWDPYHHNDILQLEKVQRRAARWVLNDYNRYSSVTAMLQQLSWQSLESRRKIFRLQTLFKIIHHDYALQIPYYYLPMTRSTRQYHPRRFILPNSNVTGPEKTGLIYTKYTCSHFGTYFFFCVCYLISVSCVKFIRISCIYDEICVEMLCCYNEILHLKN